MNIEGKVNKDYGPVVKNFTEGSETETDMSNTSKIKRKKRNLDFFAKIKVNESSRKKKKDDIKLSSPRLKSYESVNTNHTQCFDTKNEGYILKSPTSQKLNFKDENSIVKSPMTPLGNEIEFTQNDSNSIERNKLEFESHSKNSDTSSISTQSTSSGQNERYCISIDELMGESPRLRKTIIYLIILRVVSSSVNNESRPFIVKNFKRKSFNEGKSNYSRLFLCMDVHNTSGQTVYIAQGKGIGQNLWSKAANKRDNGSIGIGTIVAVPSPKPITKLLANEIPIIESNSSLLICKHSMLNDINIDESVTEQCTRGFIMNNCEVKVKRAEVVASNCSGSFCDRQRTSELLKTGKKCGCYVMRGTCSNLAVIHTIEVVPYHEGTTFSMDEFSSMKFSLLYLQEYFPKSTQRISFDLTENEDNLYESIDNVMNYYNINGGFTVVGWYKRGEVNDVAQMEESTEKVSSSIVTKHITSIYPTHFSRLHAPETNELKLDVLNIN